MGVVIINDEVLYYKLFVICMCMGWGVFVDDCYFVLCGLLSLLMCLVVYDVYVCEVVEWLVD